MDSDDSSPYFSGPGPTAVIAMGGHAFMQPGQPGTHEDHVLNARLITSQIMTLVNRGYRLVITHGNGPQVGDLLLRDEASDASLGRTPLDVLVAQTEGSLGYYLQQAMLNQLRHAEVRRYVVTVVTQVIVDPDDPAFDAPIKPVGPYLTQADAEKRADELGWAVAPHPDGLGWRRLVPSPKPLRVVQRNMIRRAAERGSIVIAAGGGGIPICKDASDDYVGLEAVIDKDLTSAILATDVGADLLIILTAVDQVYLRFGHPDQVALGAVTLAECKRHIDAGHFPAGSMGPKVQAIYEFLQRGGSRALITSAERLNDAMDGQAGTHFVGRI